MNIKLLQFVMPAGAPCLFAPNTHILLCQAYVREKPSVAERRTHTEVHPIVAPASSGSGLEGCAATLHTYNTLQTSEVRKTEKPFGWQSNARTTRLSAPREPTLSFTIYCDTEKMSLRKQGERAEIQFYLLPHKKGGKRLGQR